MKEHTRKAALGQKWGLFKAELLQEADDFKEGWKELKNRSVKEQVKEAARMSVVAVACFAAFGGNYWARHQHRHNILKDYVENGVHRIVKPHSRGSLKGAPSPSSKSPAAAKGGQSTSK